MKPKILFIDIETSFLTAHTWGLFDQNITPSQLVKDSVILSWSAKWAHEKNVMYMDQRNNKNIKDDTKLILSIWKLLDEADIVVGQNSKRFDIKRLNASFVLLGLGKPSSFRQIDTLEIAKRNFGFPSYKLEYMSEKLCKKYKKLKHKKFPGNDLWLACLNGNKEAWKEMECYNKHDVLCLEELYYVFQNWDSTINFDVYHDNEYSICKCGNDKFVKNGFHYSSTGRYQRWKCTKCKFETRDGVNLLSKEKRDTIKRKI